MQKENRERIRAASLRRPEDSQSCLIAIGTRTWTPYFIFEINHQVGLYWYFQWYQITRGRPGMRRVAKDRASQRHITDKWGMGKTRKMTVVIKDKAFCKFTQ